jgi:hypothetical protein
MSDISLRPLARAILDQCTSNRKIRYQQTWAYAQETQRRLNELIDKYLSSSRDPNMTEEVSQELRINLVNVYGELSSVITFSDQYASEGYVNSNTMTVDEMLADLEQCQREMSELRWNIDEKWISAITEPIILKSTLDNSRRETGIVEQDINFGRFEIRLSYIPYTGYGQRKYLYSVVALEPNYPLSQRPNGSYSHPHLQGPNLCEGEATAILSQALNNLRFCDFFILINAILINYNSDSPYFPLEDWNRIRCRECGNYVEGENLVTCSYCDNKICTNCASTKTCAICNKIICSRHKGQRRIIKCNKCDQYICLQHYQSIRKHTCFKEIKQERIEKAANTLKLIEVLKTVRLEIAESSTTQASDEQQNESNIESVEPVRPDHRTEEQIRRDLEAAERGETPVEEPLEGLRIHPSAQWINNAEPIIETEPHPVRRIHGTLTDAPTPDPQPPANNGPTGWTNS